MIYIACAGDAPLHVSSALLGYITSFDLKGQSRSRPRGRVLGRAPGQEPWGRVTLFALTSMVNICLSNLATELAEFMQRSSYCPKPSCTSAYSGVLNTWVLANNVHTKPRGAACGKRVEVPEN